MSESALSKLSVAFIWHMHQPEYKDDLTGEYLMPWVRLHAIKDYLDMVAMLEEFSEIRQTFNLVPSLIDQLEDYCRPETMDRHLKLMLQDTLSDEDKTFIFQRFFDAKGPTMIARSPYYYEMFEQRNAILADGDVDISQFTDEEYFDIMALFHLVWTDPYWLEQERELKKLWDKQRGYTLADRTRIIELQREIIARTLPTYKDFQERGQIEVTTTPYYHPILPLLIDSESARVAMPDAVLPDERFQFPQDAEFHVQAAKEKYRSLFGADPVGVWPAEQSISPEAIKMFKDHGFQWAVSSEGNLSLSLGIPLEKDPFGNIQNVELICRPYTYEGVKLLFRHLTLSDLIGFHYAGMPPIHAASDCYQRLKQIQRRCTAVGLKDPIVTIALDGENCWESYANDGHDFLNQLYTMLSEDETLDVCRVKDYFQSVPAETIQPLARLHAGSWINSNFHIWIADPVKNAAWNYLYKTRADLAHITQLGHHTQAVIDKAWKELYIAEGSDWFWWYGEPHNSGQDEVFDMQFRRHLANVYRLLDLDIPDYLDIPLTITMGRPVSLPIGPMTPALTGRLDNEDAWERAGCFDMSHGAMHRATRVLKKVYFGSDEAHCYLRFYLNREAITPHHEIFLYFCLPGKTRHNSPVRIKSASGHVANTQRYHYAYEVQIGNLYPEKLNVSAAEALPDHLWCHRPDVVAGAAIGETLDLALSFDQLGIHPEEVLQFTVAVVQGDILDELQPENYVLSVQRYPAYALASGATYKKLSL